MINVKACPRCDGCGWVAGIRNWERPLVRLVATFAPHDALPSMLVPRPCGDCGGGGLDMSAQERAPRLPRAFLYGRGAASN